MTITHLLEKLILSFSLFMVGLEVCLACISYLSYCEGSEGGGGGGGGEGGEGEMQ